MKTTQRLFGLGSALGVVALATACGGDDLTETQSEPPNLVFSQAVLDLGEGRNASVQLQNAGSRSLGPIAIEASAVALASGSEVPGTRLQVVPTSIPTLNAGEIRSIALSVIFDLEPAAGDYEVSLEARVADESGASLGISFSVVAQPPIGITETIQISSGSTTPRQGDVTQYIASTLDENGDPITDPSLIWFLSPTTAGLIMPDGRFVGYETGPAQIVATAAGKADTLDVIVEARDASQGGSASFSVLGQNSMTSWFTSDLWVRGDFAYTGTWGCRSGAATCGDRIHVWNVSNPATPQFVGQAIVDARTVNDIKIRDDGQIAVMSHESSNDGLNGVTILGLNNPGVPQILSRFTQGLEAGVHNVWIDGDFVYIAVNGVGNGMRVLDISNPSSPRAVASNFVGSSFLHDIYIRDGLAFLSQWDDGLIILDIGHGIAGGSPSNPQEVGRVQTAGGQTHNAWYWPTAGYVFVGEEDFGTPGVMHVVDARNLTNPVEVATFRLAGDPPHNFWLDEARGILYMAWYGNGIIALDVSGELLGQLEKQDRQIASISYGSGFGCPFGTLATCSWAPQLENGRIFVSDLNTGLWILQPNF